MFAFLLNVTVCVRYILHWLKKASADEVTLPHTTFAKATAAEKSFIVQVSDTIGAK